MVGPNQTKDLNQIDPIVVGVMKMGNTAPRLGREATSLAFRASVLPFHHVGTLTELLYSRPPAYAAPCLRGQCRLEHCHSWCWLALCENNVTQWVIVPWCWAQ